MDEIPPPANLRNLENTAAYHCQACGADLEAHEIGVCAKCRAFREQNPPVPRAPADLVAERYRLIRPLGSGGFGEVWLASEEQTKLDAGQPAYAERNSTSAEEAAKSPGLLFAIKFTKQRHATGETLEGFRHERRQLSRLRDEHIARVRDALLEDQREPLLVMEYVDGEHLDVYCDQRKLTVQQRLNVFLDVCRGMSHAHRCGVEHRDLKPSNILVTEVYGRPVPKIIDFGLASDADHKREHLLRGGAGGFSGCTIAYASPAQLRGEPEPTGGADVYALGVILYQLLTDSCPVTAELLAPLNKCPRRKVLEAVAAFEPPTMDRRLLDETKEASRTAIAARRGVAVWQLEMQLRSDLQFIVAGALQRNARDRIRSVDDLTTNIEDFLDHRICRLRPRTRTYVTAKFIRRNAIAAAVVTVIASILLAATGVSLRLANKAQIAKANAQNARDMEAEQRRIADANASKALEQQNKAEVEKQRAEREKDRANGLAEEQKQQLRRFSQSSFSQAKRHFDVVETDAPLETKTEQWRLGVMRLVEAIGADEDNTAALACFFQEIAARPDLARALPSKRLNVTADRSVAYFSLDRTYAISNGSNKVWNIPRGEALFTLPEDVNLRFASFSPDGKRLLTVDDALREWSMADGELIETRPYLPSDGFTEVYYDWVRGRLLTTEEHGNRMLLFGGGDGKSPREMTTSASVRAAEISHDGRYILAIAETEQGNGSVEVFDATSGRQLLSPSSGEGLDAKFSPDSSSLAVTSSDNTVQILALPRGRVLQTLSHAMDVIRVRFSRDGSQIATCSQDHQVRVWDVKTGTLLHKLDSKENVDQLDFSSDARFLVSAGSSLSVWDLQTGTLVRRIEDPWDHAYTALLDSPVWLSGEGNTVYAIQTMEDQEFVTAWDVNVQPGRVRIALNERPDTFSQDGDLIYCASDSPNYLWLGVLNAKTGKLLHAFSRPGGSFAGLCHGRKVVMAKDSQTIGIYDAATGVALREFSTAGKPVSGMFSANGERLLINEADGNASIWNPTDGRLLTTIPSGSVTALSGDGKWTAALAKDGEVCVWDASSGRAQFRIQTGPNGKATPPLDLWPGDADLFFTNDSRRLVVCKRTFGPMRENLSEWVAVVCDTATGNTQTTRSPKYPSRVVAGPAGIVVSRNGAWLAACDAGSGLQLWNLTTGPIEDQFFRGFDGAGRVTFSPDGRRTVLDLADGSKAVVETATGAEMYRIPLDPGEPHDVLISFSDESRYFALEGESRTGVMETATGKLLLHLPPNEGYPRVLFNPNGESVLVQTESNGAELWKLDAVAVPNIRIAARSVVASMIPLFAAVATGLQQQENGELGAIFASDHAELAAVLCFLMEHDPYLRLLLPESPLLRSSVAGLQVQVQGAELLRRAEYYRSNSALLAALVLVGADATSTGDAERIEIIETLDSSPGMCARAAAILYEQRRFRFALMAAEKGLERSPENAACQQERERAQAALRGE